jgi:phosphonate transport system substrate-binding protein
LVRVLSYLAPSIPYEFFRAIADDLAAALGTAVELTFEERTSGPLEGGPDPLSSGEVDIAFLCAPTYLRLARAGAVQLLAAPISTDRRSRGRPVYFSEVVVAADAPARTITDLVGARWALNDPASLSGFHCVVDAIGQPKNVVISGSHLASLELVRRGLADAAAIDSNVLRVHRMGDGLRAVGTLGPHPIQPVVARQTLEPSLMKSIREALLTLSARSPGRLLEFGFVGFAPVDAAHYSRPTLNADRRATVDCQPCR